MPTNLDPKMEIGAIIAKNSDSSSGSLTVVGTGISLVGQITLVTQRHIELAGKVLYLVADPASAAYISRLNSTAESLFPFYNIEKDRLTTYLEMVEHILSYVRRGLDVCAAFYGHPGVFALPPHVAINRARNEGYAAQMLPGISAEDCLFADLGVDPGACGCQNFEATDFLVYRRTFDPRSYLILWQIGVIGEVGYKATYEARNLDVLVETLQRFYPLQHGVVVYEASQYPVCEPVIQYIPLSKLERCNISSLSTLLVPPLDSGVPDFDMYDRLGMRRAYAQSSLEVKHLFKVPGIHLAVAGSGS